MSNEEIIDLSLERIQNEVYNGELTDDQMSQIRSTSLEQLLILRQSDFLIGEITNDLILIQFGQDEEKDKAILNIMNTLVGIYYPQLRNISPNSIYNNLPDENAENYESICSFYESVINDNPITQSQQQNLINDYHSSENLIIKRRKNFSEDNFYYENYDFDYLEEYLKDHHAELILTQISGMNLKSLFVYIGLSMIEGFSFAISETLYFAINLVTTLTNNGYGVNDYEIAVIARNALLIISKASNALDILYNYPTNMANQYYQRFYVKEYTEIGEYYPFNSFEGCSFYVDNNTLNAYKHTMWNALMTVEFSDSFAKEFSDAHEYGFLMNSEESITHNAKLSVDMDLLNNASGRNIGTWWNSNSVLLIPQMSNFYNREVSAWEGLAEYVYHCVSYGDYYQIYTFGGNRTFQDGSLFIPDTWVSTHIKNGPSSSTPPTVNDALKKEIIETEIEGLIYTNFGEAKQYIIDNPLENDIAINYPGLPYFYYPPKC